MSERRLTSKDVAAWIKAVDDEKWWITHSIWKDRLGEEKWDPRHGTTRSFKKPGKLRKEGAISTLEYVKRTLELFEKIEEAKKDE